MAGDVHRREDWADHLLAVCGRWWTATRAWTTRDALDGDGLADLRTYLGWARPTAEVKAADSYAGTFQVLGGYRSLTTAGSSSSAPGSGTRRRARCCSCSTSRPA